MIITPPSLLIAMCVHWLAGTTDLLLTIENLVVAFWAVQTTALSELIEISHCPAVSGDPGESKFGAITVPTGTGLG